MILKILMAVLIVVVAVAGYAAYKSSRAAYETAPYQVIRTDGEFQLRAYPAMVIVATPMQGADNSFMRLFRYIDGQNAADQKIAMTTPVFMTGDATNRSMSFVMPREMAREETPPPRDAQVAVEAIPAGTFAVRRFRGGRRAANEAAALAQLTDWMKQENLAPVGAPIFGYFDPPWTPVFLRRNEVMQRVAP